MFTAKCRPLAIAVITVTPINGRQLPPKSDDGPSSNLVDTDVRNNP